MIGGAKRVEHLDPIFKTIALDIESTLRTENVNTTVLRLPTGPWGWTLRQMVHNGVEYALMQAYAEA